MCGEGKELTRALEDLSRMSVDPTFALQFFTRKGTGIHVNLAQNVLGVLGAVPTNTQSCKTVPF